MEYTRGDNRGFLVKGKIRENGKEIICRDRMRKFRFLMYLGLWSG